MYVMLPAMEAKQPLSDQDWQATPEPVRQYIRQLEQAIAVHVLCQENSIWITSISEIHKFIFIELILKK